MVSLKTVGARFDTLFTVIQGGTGILYGELSETEQNSQPSYVFVAPRHVMRTRHPTALKPGLVIQSPAGEKFVVGDNGPSEQRSGTIWDSFRLFEVTGRYTWKRREQVLDPITKQLRDNGQFQDMGTIWATIEPLDRLAFDREIHYSFGQARLITGSPVQENDLVDNRAVSKLDKQLGLYIALLT